MKSCILQKSLDYHIPTFYCAKTSHSIPFLMFHHSTAFFLAAIWWLSNSESITFSDGFKSMHNARFTAAPDGWMFFFSNMAFKICFTFVFDADKDKTRLIQYLIWGMYPTHLITSGYWSTPPGINCFIRKTLTYKSSMLSVVLLIYILINSFFCCSTISAVWSCISDSTDCSSLYICQGEDIAMKLLSVPEINGITHL